MFNRLISPAEHDYEYVESSDCDHICIEGENISFSDNARNLGVYFDCTFSMEHHLKQLCKSLFFLTASDQPHENLFE